jgi:hypothetical protein
MNDCKDDRGETHRLALAALDQIIRERARMGELFALIDHPIELRFGDLEGLLAVAKPLAATATPAPGQGGAPFLMALKQMARNAGIHLRLRPASGRRER